MATVINIDPFYYSETLAATGDGDPKEAFLRKLMKDFSIQVSGVGAAPTSWVIHLKGSLTGTEWDTLLTHDSTTGNDGIFSTGSQCKAVMFVKLNVESLVLGSATGIKITVAGR